ncbi:MAG: hypothetical protein ACT4NJ_07185 [Nitrosopumilaceae archaeon]
MLKSQDENAPKHTIANSAAFQKGRENLGNLILNKMSITGGTDVDWLIERKGGFIILESKEFSVDAFTISLGQMIALENLYDRLISGGKCYFYIFGYEKNTDWKNPNQPIWYFEMNSWKNGKIPKKKSKTGKWYIVEKNSMTKSKNKIIELGVY